MTGLAILYKRSKDTTDVVQVHIRVNWSCSDSITMYFTSATCSFAFTCTAISLLIISGQCLSFRRTKSRWNVGLGPRICIKYNSVPHTDLRRDLLLFLYSYYIFGHFMPFLDSGYWMDYRKPFKQKDIPNNTELIVLLFYY